MLGVLATVLACTGWAAVSDTSSAVTTAPTQPVNLLVVSIDTLRRDRIGRWSGGDTTPVLDAWLGQSLVLEQHRACASWTYPAMLCFFTGAYPTDVGFMPRNTEPAPPGLDTLAERLGEAGFQSHMVGAQYLFAPETGIVQGFDQVEVDGTWSAEQVVTTALAAAEDMAEPWFLQAHFLDPHLPYTAPAAHERRPSDLPTTEFDLTDDEVVHGIVEGWDDLDDQERAALLANVDVLYEAEIRYADAQIGVLLDGLEALGRMERTLVVVVSDHGEQFYDHDQFEHGGSLYGEETWALAALQGPGVAAGQHAGTTKHIDLVPTVLDRLGLPAAPLATGLVVGAAPPERATFAATSRARLTLQSAQLGSDRLQFNWGLETFIRHDLAVDPGELTDLYDPEDPVDQALVDVLWPQVERLAEVMQTDVPGRPD